MEANEWLLVTSEQNTARVGCPPLPFPQRRCHDDMNRRWLISTGTGGGSGSGSVTHL